MSNAYMATDWGSIPDWIGGVGTAISLFVVSSGLIWEMRRRRLDDNRLADERRESERALARLVRIAIDTDEKFNVQITIANDASMPIYDIELTLRNVPTVNPNLSVKAHEMKESLPSRLAPGASASVSISPYMEKIPVREKEPLVPLADAFPGVSEVWHGIRYSHTDSHWVASWQAKNDMAKLVAIAEIVVSVEFTDANGLRWERWMGERVPEQKSGVKHDSSYRVNRGEYTAVVSRVSRRD
ncbi:hypothetical protein [Catellatospora methionotrophica]|uniref:hypothetical protein n=1 Tax=Catellatospora methionotrophica TaxID=121620 RepID=UPI0033C171E5